MAERGTRAGCRWLSLLAGWPILTCLALACGSDKQPPPTHTAAPTVAPTPTAEPAAETLAFVRDGDIWLVDADGSDERRLTQLGAVQEFTWVAATELDVVTGLDRSGHLLVDTNGNVQDLSFPPGGSWSPDGALYVVPVGEDVVAFDRDGSEVVRLHPGPSFERCGKPPSTELRQYRLDFGRPSFVPGGQELLIAVHCWTMSGAYNFYGSIYRVSLDGAVNEGFPDPQGGPQLNLRGLVGPLFSPDGQRIAWAFVDGFSLCPFGRSLIVADQDGGNRRGLGPAALTDLLRSGSHPDTVGGVSGFDWSPQSDALVVAEQVYNCSLPSEPVFAGLHILALDGSEEKLLDGEVHSLAWSPSGRVIAYVTGRYFGQPAGPATIRLFELATGQVTDLTQGSQPAWQPQP